MVDPADQPEVLLFLVDAGSGHRNTARALVAASEESRVAWRFRLVNYQSIFDQLDFTRHITGLSVEDLYNFLLRRQWTGTLVPLLRVLHLLIRLRRKALLRSLTDFLAAQRPRPAALLSVAPHFNGVLRDAARQALPGVPVVVQLTDYADYPPGFWIEPGVDRVIVGCEYAVQQALRLGLPRERITRTSGMVIHASFSKPVPPDARHCLRSEMGFADGDLVLLMIFGGKGSAVMPRLAEALLRESPEWRVIAVCGENADLVARMQRAAAHSGRIHVLGFTQRVPELMAASDMVVTKPGPGTLAEAFQMRVPVLVVGNWRTIPQERYNTRLVAAQDLGLVVHRWADAPAAVKRWCQDPAAQARTRANLAGLPENRAAHDALDVLRAEMGLERT